MRTSILAATLITLAGPVLAQAPADHGQHHQGDTTAVQAQTAAPVQPQTAPDQPRTERPMGHGMPGGMMSGGMTGGRGMMGRFSSEDSSALIDAHIAAIHTGLKLSADQEKLWPPVETAIRNLATLHLSHMQAMRQTRGMMAGDPVGLLRTMADRMSQGADAMRKLADAASPLYATLDESQKRRLRVLVRMGGRGMMGPGMMVQGVMGSGGSMMPSGSGFDDGDNADSQENR
ncbi:Spy/CpxP family protein refolding chaperone [Microvirga sp. VF16]|uniref:Spy/CpxP family protein refolding chaperone n=1 Tax=Microvirga sp. VF16 TaxID=2807101 RepID=UPI00193CEB32|nr:Spy/CpxP family protein refolding chaperone [Microvirga sp. VF16]QRM35193.1 Spy/CpxP family protein refolding chaperone [Microvirga sp. VF16]